MLLFSKKKQELSGIYLPIESFFKEKTLSWQSVYYHYRKWCKILEKSDRLHGVLSG
ncbi:hypothetical protein ACLSZ5_10680 [Avibacterium avium]|uniref:hypothetical protein n=1 Tax=Avibacterium avium TaxID=751 RepID=UPI003BF7D4A9